MKCYFVTDGEFDTYGIFTSRELAEAWIREQQRLGFNWHLQIDEWPLDEAEDLI